MNESKRSKVVRRLMQHDFARDTELNDIVKLTAALFNTPIVLITLLDDELQYIEVKTGTDLKQVPIYDTFCQYLMDKESFISIPDVTKDSRYTDESWLKTYSEIRFYAGTKLDTDDGLTLGSLCIMDRVPKTITDEQKHLLKVIANQVMRILNLELGIGELKRQARDAQKAEIKLRSFFESSGTCHLLLGKELDVITFNKSMEHTIKQLYNIQLYNGMLVSEILPGAALDRFIVEYNVALSGKTISYEREVEYTHKTVWWSVTFEPGYDKQDEVIGVSYNANDITERKHQEQKITTQNNALKEIAYIQSHEVRRPVASILGFMELFKLKKYRTTTKELQMMEHAVNELDDKIRTIINLTDHQ